MKNNYKDINFFELEITELKTQLHEIQFAKKVDKTGDLEENFNIIEQEKMIKENIKHYKDKNKTLNTLIRKMLKKCKKIKKEDLIIEHCFVSDQLNETKEMLKNFQKLDNFITTPLLLLFISVSESWTDEYMTIVCNILGFEKNEITELINTYKNKYSKKIETIGKELEKAEAKMQDPDYKVGYGKPPKYTQFQKGKKGNKKGRKSIKNKSIKELTYEKLDDKITVTRADGKKVKRYRRDVIAEDFANKMTLGKPIPRNNMKMMEKLDQYNNFCIKNRNKT